MKLNVIKIKKLKIKIYYSCEKKNYFKIFFTKINKNNEKMNRNIKE